VPTVDAVQFSVVLLFVVPEAVRDVGAPGTVAQVGANVVTLSVLLSVTPSELVAAILKLYVVEAVNPVTA